MPHEDGGAYAPVVATVSLGAPICLEITSKPEPTIKTEGEPLDKSASIMDSIEDVSTVCEDEDNDESNDSSSNSRKPSGPYRIPTRILQEPRSLLITTGPAYASLLHGISPIEIDENLTVDTVANWDLLAEPHVFDEAGGRNERAIRISLTYRDVLKVSSAASKVFGGLSRT